MAGLIYFSLTRSVLLQCILTTQPWRQIQVRIWKVCSLIHRECHFSFFALGAVPRSALPLPDDTEEIGYDCENPTNEPSTIFKKHCKKCKAFKPVRAHHCSYCKRCIVKVTWHIISIFWMWNVIQLWNSDNNIDNNLQDIELRL